MKKHLNKLSFFLVLIIVGAGCNEDSKVPVVEMPVVTSFTQLIQLVEEADSATQFELIDEFLDSLSFPYFENDSTVYFLYRGKANSVAVAGDFTGWNPRGTDFSKLGETDLWYREESFESNARLDYKLVINGSNWILDPKNPNRIGGGFGPNSELAMPAYVQPWEVVEQEAVAKGDLQQLNLPSTNTGKTYQVYIYTPPSYNSTLSYPVAYFQDGSDYLNLAQSTTVIDNLIDAGTVEPLMAVFVVPNNRNVEYAFDDRFRYTDFFVKELVPYVDQNFATDAQASRRAVIGDSYGGNISAIISFKNPDVFGNCGIHSGAFQPNNFDTNSIVMDGEKKDIRVASIWGTYEGTSLPPNMRRVRDYLDEKGYDLMWNELPEGHSWGLWRATQDDMLQFFFPAAK